MDWDRSLQVLVSAPRAVMTSAAITVGTPIQPASPMSWWSSKVASSAAVMGSERVSVTTVGGFKWRSPMPSPCTLWRAARGRCVGGWSARRRARRSSRFWRECAQSMWPRRRGRCAPGCRTSPGPAGAKTRHSKGFAPPSSRTRSLLDRSELLAEAERGRAEGGQGLRRTHHGRRRDTVLPVWVWSLLFGFAVTAIVAFGSALR